MKSIQKKKKLIFFAYEKLCSSKISTGFLLTIVRRSIRGSDFRLSPISRSNHPGFYRVITPSYLADIFFFSTPSSFLHSKSGGTINAAIPSRASRLSNRPIFFAICKHSRLLTWRFPLSSSRALFRIVEERGLETKFQKYEIKSNSRSNDRSTVESPPFFFRRK